MQMSIIKHNDRSLRRPCKSCGRGGSADRSLILYWAHDTDRPGEQCEACTARDGSPVSGKWVMVESTGALHACQTNGPEGPPNPAKPPATPATGAVNQADAANQIATLLAQLAPTVDMSKVIATVNE